MAKYGSNRELERPNGVALSPKQLTLYAADSARQQVWAFEIAGDGSLSKGHLVAELKSDQPDAVDGLKTGEAGNIYVAGPGVVWIFTAMGKHLGTIAVPETPSNCAWGRAGSRACTSRLVPRSTTFVRKFRGRELSSAIKCQPRR